MLVFLVAVEARPTNPQSRSQYVTMQCCAINAFTATTKKNINTSLATPSLTVAEQLLLSKSLKSNFCIFDFRQTASLSR